MTVNIDCTRAYENAKASGVSFFTYYLHKTLEAMNASQPMRLRISGDEVYIYDSIGVSATILRADKTFGFSYMDFDPDLQAFARIAKDEIARIQNTTGLLTREYPENIIHFSAMPWIDFTSFSHARSFTFPDSCPKVSFGKMTEKDGVKTMPMVVHVHHALMDGYHLGVFLEDFQRRMNL